MLRKVAVSFAMLALPLSSPAWAAIPGQPDPADVQAVESCLKNAKSANSSPDSCIGVVAKACQASASTAQTKEACNQREEEVWSVAITRDYARLTTIENSAGLQQALRDAQTGYERAKLGLCTFERIAGHNTPNALLAASTCRLDAAGRQDLWLATQFDNLTKK